MANKKRTRMLPFDPSKSRIPESQTVIIANRLRSLRKNAGLSYVSLKNELKSRYGINICRDSLIIYEVSNPNHPRANKNLGMNIRYLSCLADFYGVSADYLLGMDDQETIKKPERGDADAT